MKKLVCLLFLSLPLLGSLPPAKPPQERKPTCPPACECNPCTCNPCTCGSTFPKLSASDESVIAQAACAKDQVSSSLKLSK